MNKGYICVDDKVIISDDNGKQTENDYCDNLNEILVKGNVVEKIESEISSLEKQKKMALFNSTFEKIIALLFPIIAIVGTPILELLMGINPLETSATTIFGFNGNNWFAPTVIGLIFSLPCTGISLLGSHSSKKKSKGFKSSIDGLQKQLEKEKTKLDELNKSKKDSKPETLHKAILIDDSKELEKVDKQSQMYYDLESYKRKLKRLYKKGKLEEYLQSQYNANQDDIKYAQECLEEKGLTLTRKR